MEYRHEYRKLSNIIGNKVTKENVLELERLVKTDNRVIKMELLSDKDALKRTMFNVHLEIDGETILGNKSFGAIASVLAESRNEIKNRLEIQNLIDIERRDKIIKEREKDMSIISSRIAEYNNKNTQKIYKRTLIHSINCIISGRRMGDKDADAISLMSGDESSFNYGYILENFDLISI